MVRPWRSASLATVIVLWSGLSLASFLYRSDFLFAWDSFGYHLYLPALFIHDDPLLNDLAWVEEAREKYVVWGSLYQITELPEGTRSPKYTVGLAILWAPWFLIGHLIALISGAVQDGYSAPYQTAIQSGVLLYFLGGLLALRKLLLAFFSEAVVSITLVLSCVATNLIDQVIGGVSMPHLPLFCLYAFITLLTREWSLHRRPRQALTLGVAMGLAILIRPSELVCLTIPFLWAGEGEATNPFVRFWRLRGQWMLILLGLILLGLPQFSYWHTATGHWIIDTYNNAGEGFDLLKPHTRKFLFSFRKGWYVYTPLMLLATGGILLLRYRPKTAFLPLSAFFLVNIYLLSSWTCWWYAESFGSRAMIGSYALMALPLGAVVERMSASRRPTRMLGAFALVGLSCLNLFQYWQFKQGIIHPSRMTRAAYFGVLGRTTRPAGLDDLLLVNRWLSGPQRGPDPFRYSAKTLPITPPASGSDSLIPDTLKGTAKHAYALKGMDQFTPAIRVPFHSLTTSDHAWVGAEWRIKIPVRPFHGTFVQTMEHAGRNYAYEGKDVASFDPQPGEWMTLRTWYLTPEVRSVEDTFVVYFWSRDTLPILVDGPYITVYERADAAN